MTFLNSLSIDLSCIKNDIRSSKAGPESPHGKGRHAFCSQNVPLIGLLSSRPHCAAHSSRTHGLLPRSKGVSKTDNDTNAVGGRGKKLCFWRDEVNDMYRCIHLYLISRPLLAEIINLTINLVSPIKTKKGLTPKTGVQPPAPLVTITKNLYQCHPKNSAVVATKTHSTSAILRLNTS